MHVHTRLDDRVCLVNNAGMRQVGSPEKFISFAELADEERDESI